MKKLFLIIIIAHYSYSSYCQKDDFHKIQEYRNSNLKANSIETEIFNDSNFNIGVKLYLKNDFEKAIPRFNLAIQSDTTFSRAYAFRAKSYYYLHNYKKALADLNKVIQYSPKDGGVYVERGNIYKIKKDTLNAIKDYNKAIELVPDNYNAYYQRANLYYDKGDFEKALHDINKFIEIRPDISYGYYMRALINRIYNYDKNVILDFKKAIIINSNNSSYFFYLGLCYQDKNRIRKAIKYYSEAIKIDSLDDYSYNNRSNSYLSIHKYQKSIDDCNKVIAINPNCKTYYIRGNANAHLKRSKEAISDYTESLRLDSNYIPSLENRAEEYYLTGNNKSSEKDFERLIKLQTDKLVPDTYILLKEWVLKDDKGLLELYNKNINVRGNSWDYYCRGQVKRKLGDKSGACQDFHEAIKRGWKFKKKELKNVCE